MRFPRLRVTGLWPRGALIESGPLHLRAARGRHWRETAPSATVRATTMPLDPEGLVAFSPRFVGAQPLLLCQRNS